MTSVCRGRRRDTHFIRRSFRLRSQIKRERIRGCIPPLDGVLRRGRRLTNSQILFLIPRSNKHDDPLWLIVYINAMENF